MKMRLLFASTLLLTTPLLLRAEIPLPGIVTLSDLPAIWIPV